ncbi:MAG: hydrogenase formation protein HypD [Deltaproteobacteria bacterium]|nr:hydrogenase formation protein HypD [Deltaproteobacteria bacterium]
MKYLDEYRDEQLARRYLNAIHKLATKQWTIMEVCGGQTHSIIKYGIDEMLPKKVTLVHGPGCPVCVTAVELIDKAIEIANQPNVIFCSFGDMLRVPGTQTDLLTARAQGADVRMVYSPLDCLKIAQANPQREVVFFSVGFETTAPGNAMAAYQASRLGIGNFSLLVSHVLVPPALKALLSSPQNRIQGLLAAGHVCTVMGYWEYEEIARVHRIPIVVTGFEPLDILQGIVMCIRQLEEQRPIVTNQYTRSVTKEGNQQAQGLMKEVFQVVSRKWRGLGEIPASGLGLSTQYESFDAEFKFGRAQYHDEKNCECIVGEILQGLKKPNQCPLFGNPCTPELPTGAAMVSAEGVCSAYYRYRYLSEAKS